MFDISIYRNLDTISNTRAGCISARASFREQVHRNFAELQVCVRMTYAHLRVVNLAKVGSLVLLISGMYDTMYDTYRTS